jgi:hypothetical protein
MKLESFEYLINSLKEASDRDNSIYKLGLDLSNISDDYQKIITHLLKVYYGEEGEDWISWFLYERREEESFQAWDENKNPICYDVESLWKHIEEIRVSSSFEEYVPKKPMTTDEIKEDIKRILNNFSNR